MQKMDSAVVRLTLALTLIPSATTNLVSCTPGCQSAGPRSWWAGGCAGTEIPSLGRRTSHTSGARRCRSPGGSAPAGPCSSTRAWSRTRWQTPPTSGPVELRPRERLWPACRHHREIIDFGTTLLMAISAAHRETQKVPNHFSLAVIE